MSNNTISTSGLTNKIMNMEPNKEWVDYVTTNYLTRYKNIYQSVYNNDVISRTYKDQSQVYCNKVGNEIFKKNMTEEPYIFTPVIILHHSDLDGYASAAIINTLFEEFGYMNIHFVKYSYTGIVFPKSVLHKINLSWPEGQSPIVIAVDLSLKKPELDQIFNLTNRFVWLDHHPTSITIAKAFFDRLDSEEKESDINAFVLIDTKISSALSCLILRDYIFQKLEMEWTRPFWNKDNPNYRYNYFIPMIISAYDTWNKEYEDLYIAGKYFNQYFFTLQNMEPYRMPIWYEYLNVAAIKDIDQYLDNILNTGKMLVDLEDQKNAVIWNNETNTVGTLICGNHKFQIISVIGHGNSFRFDPYKGVKDLCILFRYLDSNTIQVSMYSESSELTDIVPLGQLAAQFNGGGHPGAAGFTIELGLSEDNLSILNFFESFYDDLGYCWSETSDQFIIKDNEGNLVYHQEYQFSNQKLHISEHLVPNRTSSLLSDLIPVIALQLHQLYLEKTHDSKISE